jgi:hypothetical protein
MRFTTLSGGLSEPGEGECAFWVQQTGEGPDPDPPRFQCRPRSGDGRDAGDYRPRGVAPASLSLSLTQT